MERLFAIIAVSLFLFSAHAAEVQIVSVLKTGVTANELKLSNNKLYVAGVDKGVLEIDLFSNKQKVLIPHELQDDAIEAVEVFDGKLAYVINGQLYIRDLETLEILKKMNLDVDFHAYTYGNDMFHSLLGVGNKLYASTKFYGLIEVTLNNSKIRPLDTKFATKSLDLAGSTIISADNCGVSFVNPKTGTSDFLELHGCDYRAIKVVGTKAVIGSCRGLTIVDLATRSVTEQMIEMPACVGGIDYDANTNLFYMTLSGGGKAPYSQGVVAKVLIKNL